MKKSNYLIILIFLALFSCEVDDLQIESPEDALTSTKYTFEANGKKYYAGFGYTPSTDQVYRPAYENLELKQDYNFPQAAVKASYKVVRSEEDIEKYVREITKKSGSFLGIIKFSKTTRDIKKLIKIKKNRVNIIARVEYNDYRYSVKNKLRLEYSDRAKQLLDANNFSGFFERFGTSYINKQVFGGEIYYVYSYESNEINETTKNKYNRIVSGKVERLFNLPKKYGYSNADKTLLNNTRETLRSATNIGGFAPKFIRNVGDFNKEIRRSRSYLNSRKDKAAGIVQELLPYQYPGKNQQLNREFNNQRTCFEKIDKWVALKAQVLGVKDSDPIRSFFPERYDSAINFLDKQIRSSKACGSTPNVPSVQKMISDYRLLPKEDIRVKLGGVDYPISWFKRGRTYGIGTYFGSADVLLMKNLGNGRVQFNFSPMGDGRYLGPRRGRDLVWGGHNGSDPDTYFYIEHVEGDRYILRSESRGSYLKPNISSTQSVTGNPYEINENGYWKCNASRGEAIVRIRKP